MINDTVATACPLLGFVSVPPTHSVDGGGDLKQRYGCGPESAFESKDASQLIFGARSKGTEELLMLSTLGLSH